MQEDKEKVGRKLEVCLNELMGKTVMYNTHEYHLSGWHLKDGVITIAATPEWIELVETQALKKVREEFLPMEKEDKALIKAMGPINGSAKQIQDALMKNIAKVADDPKFVDQANAINKAATAFINLARLELEVLKLKSRLSGE